MFTDTVTLYNHYKDGDDDKWHRTVLSGVQVSTIASMHVDGDGKITHSGDITVTIPYRNGYVEPMNYDGEGFTFGLDNLDVLVVGESDDEVTDDLTISALIRRYQTAGTLVDVNDNTQRTLLKHWKVTAR